MATALGFAMDGIAAEASTSTANEGVAFIRPELKAMFPIYDLIDACVEGSEAVKKEKTLYLPMPDPANLDDDNLARYESYLTRTVFYNVTKRTADGLLGQIFVRPPVCEIPAVLESVKTDSNGNGIGIEQLAKDACKQNITKGRLGLFIDYPPRNTPATKAELKSGNVRPTISIFGPRAIRNWRYKTIGSKSIPCLIVLEEEYTEEDDFVTKTGKQFRELRLTDDNKYFVQLWRPKEGTKNAEPRDFIKYGNAIFPTDGKGNVLDYIPFTFIGSKNNEPSIDPAPMYDIANVNIGHYRNSADYEEMVYVVGQPMLVISGLDQNWYDTNIKGKVLFGSRKGLPLPKDAKAELLQVEPNTAAFEAMEHKERQMVALGAKLVQDKQVQRTLGEASMENAAEEATLVNIAKNVSTAIQWALECCAIFANASESTIKFELNTDFEMARMSPEEINATVKTWLDGAISTTEMRTVLRKAGRATQTDEDYQKEVDAAREKDIEAAAAEIGASTKAIADNTPPDPA